ncbi:rubredoxin [bacterium]|nr:rubredoxin [bacterium]
MEIPIARFQCTVCKWVYDEETGHSDPN